MSRLASKLGPTKLAAIAVGLIVLLTGATAGAVFLYRQSLPTTVRLNLKNGQKNVDTATPLRFTFSRPVRYEDLQSHLVIDPAEGGRLYASADRTRYTFKPAPFWGDLTTYHLRLANLNDTAGHKVANARWTFTTTIVPRVMTVLDQDGDPVNEGQQIPTGTQLILIFNDAIDEASARFLVDGKPAPQVHWHEDDKSARIYLTHVHVGPLTATVAPGAHDRTGHQLAAWTLHGLLAFVVKVHTTPLPFPAFIQIPNDPTAWDQAGLQSASIVFEYDTEGGIRRMSAMFTACPDAVGPIRSGRLISFKLVRHYHGMLFLSGLSEGTMERFRAHPVPAMFDTEGFFYRTTDRYAPNNLFLSGDAVSRAERSANVADWRLPYAANFSFPSGVGGSSFYVAEHDSQYSFDPDTGTYTKTESGHVMQDAAIGDALHASMVVVIHTTETPTSYVEDSAGAHGLDFDMQSGGRAEFYFGGSKVSGRWNGSDARNPLTFQSDSGASITLPPGMVWVDVVS